MVWSLWQLGPGTSYNWIGPQRNANDLRGMQSHLENGGAVFAQRPPGEVDAVVGRGPHGGTTEDGAMLNVAIRPSVLPSGTHAQEIQLGGVFFVGRTDLPHALVPTARYYALTRVDLALVESWPSYLTGLVSASERWAVSTAVQAAFMFTQGWLAATAIQHPVFSLPIVTIVCASCLHYFNVTEYEVSLAMFAIIGDGVMYIFTGIQNATGSPTPNTSIAIILIYLSVIGGLSSACGLSCLIWQSVVRLLKMCVHLLFVVPTRLIMDSRPTSFSPLQLSTVSSTESTLKDKAYQGVTVMDRPPVKRTATPAPTHRLPGSCKTSGRDSESEPSDETLTLPVDKEDEPVSPMKKQLPTMRHAHLLLMGRADGLAVSPKPRHGKRIKPETRLMSDLMYRSVVRSVSENGPVIAQLRNKHREFYVGRKAEFKRQMDDCYETGILMATR